MDTIAGTGLQCVRLAWHDMLWCVRHAKMGQKPCNNMIILQFYAHTSLQLSPGSSASRGDGDALCNNPRQALKAAKLFCPCACPYDGTIDRVCTCGDVHAL